MFSNTISMLALIGYSKLFDVIGDTEYADKLRALSDVLRKGIDKRFLMYHPRYGYVYTDTNDDCWTYEYKRFAQLFMYSDLFGYDISYDNPKLFDVMTRTFKVQQEQYYSPDSGRQMGYGQGYLTLTVLSLDMYEELTECMECAAMFCYHHTDNKYIVPEGVIMHGSKKYWYRNSDLGNAVQQAEIVKCSRLIAGIDDIDRTRGIRLIPRLPDTWDAVYVKDYPVTLSDGQIKKFSYSFEKCNCMSEGIVALCEGKGYKAIIDKTVPVDFIRMGPFDSDNINVQGYEYEVRKIHDRYFAYVNLKG